LYCRVCREQEQRMPPAIAFRIAVIGVAFAAAATSQAAAQGLDKVSFGTNWVAEGEHGGFYQALADGTYRKYGLDVTIVPGGPSVNNRILLPVGKIDFFLSANTLQAFDAVEQNVPAIEVAALFQKDPQVLIAHPNEGVAKFTDLKNLTLFISKEGVATYYQWLKADYGFTDSGDAFTLGIGAMTDARMKDFFDKMVRAGVTKPNLDYRKGYTLQFVDKKVGLDLRPKP